MRPGRFAYVWSGVVADLNGGIGGSEEGQGLLPLLLGQHLSPAQLAVGPTDHEEKLVKIGPATAQIGVDLLLT